MTKSETAIAMRKKFDVAVCVGRFQVFHNGHLALIRRALDRGTLCVVVIGSAFQARTPKNPFTWEERAAMIRAAVAGPAQERLRFLPVRDYYDTPRWVAAVKHGVAGFCAPGEGELPASVTLVGHLKDATSVYLNDFPGWTLDAVAEQGRIDSSALRDAWFGSAGGPQERIANALSALTSQVPASTLDFMRAWSALPYYAELAGEWQALRDEK